MTKNIYVGNLPWGISEEEVRSAFAAYGEVVSVKIINDRETGRSRGFGFVEMAGTDADKAIEALNGAELSGRSLRVNEAKPRMERESRSRDY